MLHYSVQCEIRHLTSCRKIPLITAGQRLCEKSPSQMAFRWQAVDKVAGRCKKNLRPLAMSTDFPVPITRALG